MRKRFALWLVRDVYVELLGILKEQIVIMEANDKALLELSSELNNLRNQLLPELRTAVPESAESQFNSGRQVPRWSRGERPRTGATR